MSFASEKTPRSRPVLPLAAMVDILFLLLIFFMTASIFREAEMSLDITLPAADTGEVVESMAIPLVITIDADSRIFMGPRELNLADVRENLAALARQITGETVIIRADESARTGVTIAVIDAARAAGIDEVRVATILPPDPRP